MKLKADISPTVSVLVLTYNHGPYIADCLRSILACDYPRFHIWVLDDGSTDNTAEEVDLIACKTDKITLIRQKQSGGRTAENSQRLIDESTGEYMLLISGDDMLGPSFPLDFSIQQMENDPALCLIVPRLIYLTQNLSGNSESIYSSDFKSVLQSGDPAQVLKEHLYKRVSRVFLQGMVIRRETALGAGGFDTSLLADDYAFVFRLFQYMAANRLRFLFKPDSYWLYRVHESNVHRNPMRQLLVILQVASRYIPKSHWESFKWDLVSFKSLEELVKAKGAIATYLGPNPPSLLPLRLQREFLRSARKRRDTALLCRALGSPEIDLKLKGYAAISLLRAAFKRYISRSK